MADQLESYREPPNYEHDLILAEFSHAVYFDKREIINANLRELSPDGNRFEMPAGWSLLGDDYLNRDNVRDRNLETGFVAMAFEGPDKQIVIAYRGSDNANDWATLKNGKPMLGPNIALGADGDILEELGLPLRGDKPRDQARAATAAVLPGWHAQFTQALDYAYEIQKRYPGHTIEVTGHSLGGSHAQLVSHTLGLDGRAFDPAGAKNLLDSDKYKEWLENHPDIQRNDVARSAGLPVQEPNFVNYLVNDSVVSHKSGKHIYNDHNVDISALTGRKGPGEYAQYVVGKVAATADAALDMVPPVLGLTTGPKALFSISDGAEVSIKVLAESDTLGRHDMGRIVTVFEKAVRTGNLPQFGQESDSNPSLPQERQTSGPQLNDSVHPDNAIFRQILSGVHDEDRKRGREPDALSEQVAAGLTVDAKARSLSSIGFMQFSPDGSKAYMTDTQDPSAERAKTAVGDVGRAAQHSIASSSDKAAEINQSLALTTQQTLLAQQLTPSPNPDDPGRGPRTM
jgi:hypothetical protein